jgi:hypothetical protein
MDFHPMGIVKLERTVPGSAQSEIVEEDGEQLASACIEFLHPGQIDFKGRIFSAAGSHGFSLTGSVLFQGLIVFLCSNH